MSTVSRSRGSSASTETKRISILMLTARVEERDKLLGFDVGADDYLTKPFSMKELVARVSAHLRRAGSQDAAEDDVYATAGLRIDRPRFEVEVDGRPVRLTKREFDLLWYLVRNRSRVVTRDTILARLWGYDADVETRTVDVHIRSLRRKLGERWIDTVVGVGHRASSSRGRRVRRGGRRENDAFRLPAQPRPHASCRGSPSSGRSSS